MQQAADDLLARARCTGDQHPAAGRRDALDLLAQLVDRRGGADQIEFAAGAQFQLGILAPQQRRLDRPGDDEQQPVGFERLLDEVIGAALDRRDGSLDVAMAGDHHHRQLGVLLLHAVEQLQAVEFAALQPDIKEQ